MSELSGILEELRKLNKSMEQVLCVQKLQAKLWEAKQNASNTRLGESSSGAQLERQSVSADVSVLNNGRSGGGARDTSF